MSASCEISFNSPSATSNRVLNPWLANTRRPAASYMAMASAVALSTASSRWWLSVSWRRFLVQRLFHVPLADQGQRHLLDLLARERLSDIECLVHEFHVVENFRQRPVRVRGHDDDLDVAVDLSYPADRFNAVDARRHSDVDVGHGNGTVRFLCRPNHPAGFISTGGVRKLEIRQKPVVGLLDEGRGQFVRRPLWQFGAQHFHEVVVGSPSGHRRSVRDGSPAP